MKRVLFILLISIISIGMFCGYGIAGNDDASSQSTAAIISKSESNREFGPGGSMILPGFPGNYASPNKKSFEFKPIQETMKTNPIWLKSELESFMKEDDLKNIHSEIREVYYKDLEENYRMKFSIVYPDPSKAEYLGEISIKVDDEDTTSSALHTFAGIRTCEMGGNLAVATNQGAKDLMVATGYGFSLGYTHASISGGPQKNSGVGAAGIGIAKGKSGFDQNPFVRFQIYKVPKDYFGKVHMFPDN